MIWCPLRWSSTSRSTRPSTGGASRPFSGKGLWRRLSSPVPRQMSASWPPSSEGLTTDFTSSWSKTRSAVRRMPATTRSSRSCMSASRSRSKLPRPSRSYRSGRPNTHGTEAGQLSLPTTRRESRVVTQVAAGQSFQRSRKADVIQTFLYDANGADREIDVASVDMSALGKDQLLWIDVVGRKESELRHLQSLFGLKRQAVSDLLSSGSVNVLNNSGDHFHCRVVSPPLPDAPHIRLPRP